jgi:flagellar biosynthetic protein FlhB
MSEQAGEKTEQATQKRLEEAIKRGQFPRSAEVQTIFVLMSAYFAFKFAGNDMFNRLANAETAILGHLWDIPLSVNVLQSYAITSALAFGACVGPILLATMVGGLMAGVLQNRFQTSPDVLDLNWDRLNPVEGFKRLFSARAVFPTLVATLKLTLIASMCYSEIKSILGDSIFYTAVDLAKIAGFLAEAAFKLTMRVGLALAVIAGADYAYQFWRTSKDLMMTKDEVKEEMKNTEGDPMVKARQRRRRGTKSQRKMLQDVPTADVVVTNPTHLAIALKYDRKTMKAPKIIAKGSRLNALRIREIAKQHNVPIVENKPLARMMFKYGKVDGEIPAQLYSAVAEILAWVYRVNRYRYYAEANQTSVSTTETNKT